MTDDIKLNSILILILVIAIVLCMKEFFGIERGKRLEALVMVGGMLTLFVGGIYLLA